MKSPLTKSPALLWRGIFLFAALMGSASSKAQVSFTSADTVCVPATVTFTNTSTGGYGCYYWYFSDGGSGYASGDTTHIYSYAGNFTVELYAYDSSCSSYQGVYMSKQMVVIDTAGSPINKNINIACKGEEFNFYTYESATDYYWDLGDGTTKSGVSGVYHSYTTTGQKNIMLVLYKPCGNDTVYTSVDVVDTLKPVLNTGDFYVQGNDTLVCPGKDVNFSFNYWNYPGSTHLWKFGDGDTSSAPYPIHTYSSLGSYQVWLVITNKCGNSDSNFITVHVVDSLQPAPANYYVSAYTACPDEPISFDLTNYYDYKGYKWHMGDGDSSLSNYFSHSYDTLGNYQVQLITWNGCMNYDTLLIGINIIDTIYPVINTYDVNIPDTLVCRGYPVNFSFYGYSQVKNFKWLFGDGATVNDTANVSHAYALTGDYGAMLVVFNNCGKSDTLTTVIHVVDTILADVQPSDYYVSDTVACPGTEITFDFFSSKFKSYKWYFGDGDSSAAAYALHKFDTLGDYIVKLVVTNHCDNSDTAFITVHVVDTMSVNLTMSDVYIPRSAGCPGEKLTFNFYSGNKFSSYKWFFGDGDSSLTDYNEHSYDTAGNYTVSVIAFNYCGQGDTLTTTINITDTIPVYVYPQDLYITDTVSCPGQNILFSLYASPDYKSVTWNFGDGATDSVFNPKHAYGSLGTYNGYVAVFNHCGKSDTLPFTINITNTLPLNLNSYDYYLNDTSVCPKEFISMGVYDESRYSWVKWIFGAGDTVAKSFATHNYDSAGTYTILLIAANKCGLTDTVQISILVSDSLPSDGFIVSEFSVLCPGEQRVFEAGGNGKTYVWNFGDGSPADSGYSVEHSFDTLGVYTVVLTSYNYCGLSNTDTLTVTVDSTGLPDAGFYTSTMHACVNDSVYFEPQNKNYISYKWFFGDGDSSTLVTPLHAFQSAGTYNVKLVVTNNCGNRDTFELADAEMQINGILVDNNSTPKAAFYFDPMMTCAGNNITFENRSTVTGKCSWDFGDGATDTIQNPVHAFASAGSYTVSLKLTNTCGKSDSITCTVYIKPALIAEAGMDTAICSGDSVMIGGAPTASGGTPPYQYSWSPAAGLDDPDAANPKASPDTTRIYYVTLSDSGGTCLAFDSVKITVLPYPVADFTFTNTNGLKVKFTNTTVSGTSWKWDFGDGSPADTAASPVHTFPNNTTTWNVQLIAYNQGMCPDTVIKPVDLTRYQLSGTILRNNGSDTAKGGAVYLIRYDTTVTPMPYLDTASVNSADGSYQFANVPPDNYLLLHDPDYGLYPYAVPTYYGDSTYWEYADVLKLMSGDSAGADIRLTELVPTFGPGRITGFVRRNDGLMRGGSYSKTAGPGSPIKGVKVSLLNKTSAALVKFDISDSLGQFFFDDLPVGTYHLHADTTGIPVDISLPNTTFSIDSTDTLYKNINIYIDSNKVFIVDSGNTSIKPLLPAANGLMVKAIYPNPASEQVTVEMESAAELTNVRLTLTDIRGVEAWRTEPVTVKKGKNSMVLNTSVLPDGIYLLTLRTGEGSSMVLSRLVVLKR